MESIKVDLDELKEKLDEISDDNYSVVELEISSDTYNCELKVSARDFDLLEPVEYGYISEVEDEEF